MPNALLMVRLTASRGASGSRLSAEAVPGRANSAYASSTSTMPGAASSAARTTSSSSDVPVGLLGEQRITTSGRCRSISATTAPGDSPKSAAREAARESRAGAGRQQRVHRVGRREAERGAAGAGEGLQDLLDHLVRAVGGPQLTAGQAVAEVPGQVRAQRHRVPVGVAVQPAALSCTACAIEAISRGRQRIGILVGVQHERNVQLRRAVGPHAAQFRTQRQQLQADFGQRRRPPRCPVGRRRSPAVRSRSRGSFRRALEHRPVPRPPTVG